MRKPFSIFPLIYLLFLSGCGYKTIFDGSDKDVLTPLDPIEILGDKFGDFFKGGGFSDLAPAVFEGLHEEGMIPDNVNDFAIVLNDRHFLRDIQIADKTYQWPDIDFNNYSLVVGFWADPGTTWYIKDQRVKKSLIGKVSVYLHFVKHDGGAFAMPRFRRFGAIYPKLPGGPAEVIRWEEDIIVPLPKNTLE